MADDGRVRRALLFMPGNDFKKIAKGAGLGVDSIIMDLEDAVASGGKQTARETVLRVLTSGEIQFGATERLVRVNHSSTGLQADDLAGTVNGRPDGYVLPKVESAVEVQQFSNMLGVYEAGLGLPPGTIKLLAYIETACGIVNLKPIAESDPRLVALLFGAEDLAANIGAVRTSEGLEILYAQSALVLHAAAAGVQAIDTVFIHLGDTEGLRTATERANQMGYTGKTAIHPAQVEVITAVFTPEEAEIEQARRLLTAYDAHEATGAGAFRFEEKMIDMPMIRSAQRVLARARAAGKLVD